MPVKHGIAFPMAKRMALLNITGALLDPNPVGNAPKPGTFGQVALVAPLTRLATVAPQIAASRLIPVDQFIDPLMGNESASCPAHEANDLFRTPVLTQAFAHPYHQRPRPLAGFVGPLASIRAVALSLLRAVAIGAAVTSNLSRDRATAAPNHLGYRSKAALVLQAGLNLVSLSLGQLSVSHLLFTLVGKGDEGTGGGPPTSTRLHQSAAVII